MSSEPSDAPQKPALDPEKTGYYGLDSPWRNRWSIITGKMTRAGADQYRGDASIRDELADCKRCEEWRDYCFKYSPTVIFMQKNLKALNGELNGENVKCRRCPAIKKEDGSMDRQTGGFSPEHGILLCANEMSGKKQMEDTLAHEMVHAWDHLRWKVDWADLRHAACSEIRASTLSGECRWTKEFFTRNNWTVTQQFQNCVRTRAVLSVMRRPSCKDDVQAVKVVNEVWDSCFNDTRPFDGVYR